VQYRNKTGSRLHKQRQIGQLLALCRGVGARLIVNDDFELARELGADGVHLGSEDGDITVARRCIGPDRLIGISCYNQLQRARDAMGAGADYVAFGSFFPSATKPGAVRATLELLGEARREIALPIVAIGGIDAANAVPLIRAGADALAVVSALFDSADVEATARKLCGLFDRATERGTQ